jgi:hypothetical protein
MNERIQELAEQCYEHDQSWTGVGQRILNKEKFAQLIVRECAGIAKGEPADFIDSDPYKEGRRAAGSDVLKHFGVEE